jgi:hypothetical protein
MAGKNYLSVPDAEQMLLELYDISAGKAKKLVKDAIKSGEVQTPEDSVLLMTDDGIIGMDLIPGAINPGTVTGVHKDDLLYWTKEQGVPQRQKETVVKGQRFAGDNELVTEGAEGVKSKRWPNALKAAEALAARAEGASEGAKIKRLREKIGERLNLQTSPNISKPPPTPSQD